MPTTTRAAETRLVHPVFPSDTNHYHTLFGGQAMAWMDQAAFICATRYCRRRVVTVHSSDLSFRRPVPEGSIVELVAQVARTGRTSLEVAVEMWIEPMEREGRELACRGAFTLVALGDDGKPVPVPPLAQRVGA
ncbi:acyl-CoA thioesterase [Truepera radiovictrix]|nr:acyl-CoA thioesterase [Truepera radiovictrix]WMT58186.1 acyl-CoA thioesterase [Truepera radiovictrix]